jgi:hypothetical protein
MSVAALEEYKAKYAIHEACREGQSTLIPNPHSSIQ